MLKFHRLFSFAEDCMNNQDIVAIENTKFIEILLHYRGVTN